MDAQQVIRRCRVLAECTEEPGHITRTFLSPPMREAHRLVRGWMEDAGMRVWVDAAGNMRGISRDGPRLMIGSHLDTVPHAGAFDGILGVVMGIALAARRPPCALEVVAFSEEEGVRFGVPFIGSRALVGEPVMDARVIEAIRQFGLDPAKIPAAEIGADVRGYLEFHIEQGPVLESRKLPLAVVQAIVGQCRAEVEFIGRASHAGTTPMPGRPDALAAAARWICRVEEIAFETPGMVATVGRLGVEPGASNVIAGRAWATLDARHSDASTLDEGVGRIEMEAAIVARQRGVAARWERQWNHNPTPMDARMAGALANAVRAAGYPVHCMASGAGHDAMIMARRVPSAMLFLRSPGGISHHPDESVLPQDVDAALSAGMRFLEAWRPE